MATRRKRGNLPLSQRPVPSALRERLRGPLLVILGSPAEVVHLLQAAPATEAVCYQMDLYQAERLRAELAENGLSARVETAADLWDLAAEFQTAVYLPARGGERELKIDMTEQAFHVLRPRGSLLVWSSYDTDPFFPALLKKIYGRVHLPPGGTDTVLWCQREGDRPRRRHEMTFQARIAEGPSCRFLSRPGVFSYGRLDEGTRALAEVMEVEPAQRVLDMGCGCGANGIFAAQRAGPEGFITFVDSNVRAAALTEHNAPTNGVGAFQVVASSTVEGLPQNHFDLILANPPYFANQTIARLFIERARDLLHPNGHFYLVTRQPNQIAEWIIDNFNTTEAILHRGYTVINAQTTNNKQMYNFKN